ncbi:ScbA/BarX family gamma-butyrolactone biosynthesis protein [Streptomyces flaveolus]|uniref:ScbA/BarX family gamma-butyrolactone biosynthesis protein n=1 Tax=Streptomyces flaveolus TaxID=67297 RepID=UPI003425308F
MSVDLGLLPLHLPSPVFAAGELGRGLSFDRPVPRAAVHKRAVAEVLVTGAARLAEDRFAVAACWPADHRLYRPVSGCTGDSTFLVETVRQAAIYLCHRFYGIPLSGRPFVLSRIEVDIDAPGLPYDPARGLPVLLEAVCTRTTGAPRRFGMAMEATVYISGVRRGRAHVVWEVMDERRYALVRSRNCPEPVPGAPVVPVAGRADLLAPEVVGRRQVRDVLLAADPRGMPQQWQLVLDESHPVYFDHGSDHVPGMVLLEAVRQAAHAAAVRAGAGSAVVESWTPLSLAASFERFAALDAPVVITADACPEGGVFGYFDFYLTAAQHDRTLVRVRLRGARPASWAWAGEEAA